MRVRLLICVAVVVACVAPAAHAATDTAVPASSPVATLYADHTVYAHPSPSAKRIAFLSATRPITGERTSVPILDHHGVDGQWLKVRVPGRPNGRTGWIDARNTETESRTWALVVQLTLRRVLVYHQGRLVRTFTAIVGKPSTPTPRGHFFVEEVVRMARTAAGAPWALATSARSDVLERYEGGVGQIALHGTGNLPGVMGTAASHGCVRLLPAAITYLASRIDPGTPVTLQSR